MLAIISLFFTSTIFFSGKMPRGKRQRPVPTYVFHFWAFDKETKSFGEPFEFQLDKGMDCKTFEELFQIMTDRTRRLVLFPIIYLKGLYSVAGLA